MLEFVDSGLYFVQDENNFINPLLQVGSVGPKIRGSDRIRIAYVHITLTCWLCPPLTSWTVFPCGVPTPDPPLVSTVTGFPPDKDH